MKIAIASDHAGFAYKKAIIENLTQKGHAVADFGTLSEESCDYPDFALPACNSVVSGENELGILVCGTGIGMGIAANKIKGIRCAVCCDDFTAEVCREHNNANVMALGARIVSLPQALSMCEQFISASFLGGRHQQRLDKITRLEEKGEKDKKEE